MSSHFTFLLLIIHHFCELNLRKLTMKEEPALPEEITVTGTVGEWWHSHSSKSHPTKPAAPVTMATLSRLL
ncbi:hypothetical protein Q7C36_008305 [Tachysurus vachellii]|uniref:Uncharacterized protein n=1 Tax=Tachysurus vachellii TaxID=175792 RepID=A0AA88N7U4_TACVA|nr:hypothetical protein Q7C36_008305 [Tachysurus vachellii]